MIQFSLKCDRDHQFDSWFQSAGAFDTLKAQGLVTCAVCGSEAVEKAVMAPRVSTTRSSPANLSQPASPAEQALAELRRKIETGSDYVGNRFAEEARRIHEGEADARSIHGEARLDDARKLIDDGIPVVPLPFMSNRKAN
ncbi:hypothetical protein OB2597_15950 [Pseudooceanicola batsensis HTCC2597]|uniref:DUF1178 family protein n=1 Tax=Pseudooceanicola batsensis (strain ATCC BAA-863 / DSM 15984 / KCTC 12145 / HTCC2597) TaxID=252305 RepID=A3TZ72_PSEBH|nr:DUF1178 family protein [Pseudooceanicola batsensis]EAQ02890.1 hypothetical protein OB2597_15950 [Pseudooceanicola batsensis HTCC2597]